MKHYPVMLKEVLASLSPVDGEIYLDGTFGNGGYTEAFLRSSQCKVVAFDRDPDVVSRVNELSGAYEGRLEFVHAPFSEMGDRLSAAAVDAVILDIGVSSMQLDQAERGFSFMKSGPLDMRMSQAGPSAADAVRELSLGDLIQIFKVYGEERRARRAAQFIVEAREKESIVTTDQLALVLERALGKGGKIHPATRVFQALRIFINDELGELYQGLVSAEKILKPGGRLIVVTFHSLEDRMVKQFVRSRSERPSSGSRYMPDVEQESFYPSFKQTQRSTIKPSEAEIAENARSRSAKLRFAIRTENDVMDIRADNKLRVPRLSDFRWAS